MLIYKSPYLAFIIITFCFACLFYSLEIDFFPDPNLNYLVILIDRLGLANRLRIIAGFYSITIITNSTLVVIWVKSDECGACYSDLFEKSPINMIVHDIDDVSHGSLEATLKEKSAIKNLNFSTVYATDFYIDIPRLLNLYENLSSRQVTLFWSLGTHTLNGINCNTYLNLKSSFYQSLRPLTHIRSKFNVLL